MRRSKPRIDAWSAYNEQYEKNIKYLKKIGADPTKAQRRLDKKSFYYALESETGEQKAMKAKGLIKSVASQERIAQSIARAQTTFGTESQWEAVKNYYARMDAKDYEGKKIPKKERFRRKDVLYRTDKFSKTLHDYNEALKAKGYDDSYDRAVIIGKEFFGSP